jgi:hypothetical protein
MQIPASRTEGPGQQLSGHETIQRHDDIDVVELAKRLLTEAHAGKSSSRAAFGEVTASSQDLDAASSQAFGHHEQGGLRSAERMS